MSVPDGAPPLNSVSPVTRLLGHGWSGWGQVGYQRGGDAYRDVNGQLGLKLSW
jgi:outer membrane autotransporter protein